MRTAFIVMFIVQTLCLSAVLSWKGFGCEEEAKESVVAVQPVDQQEEINSLDDLLARAF